jgi:site-specific recombinase XerD
VEAGRQLADSLSASGLQGGRVEGAARLSRRRGDAVEQPGILDGVSRRHVGGGCAGGAGREAAGLGTVGWLVAQYFASLDFTDRPKSVQQKHRRYLEEFRIKHGDKVVSIKRGDIVVPIIDQAMVEKWFAKLIDTPAKANKWLSAMRDLFTYATKCRLLTGNPAAEIKRRKAKIRIGEDGEAEEGHLTWPVKVVAMAREKFPVGTEMRLAIEMINTLAFRRSDAIRVGLPMTYQGVLEDGRPATFLKYTQWKNRENKPVTVDTPVPSELLAIIKATRATGLKTWLIGKRGGSFTEQGFTDWFADEMAKAGMPKHYTPHGLRKRCLTDLANQGKTIHQIMAISGHLTVKEVERYTRMADRARNARAAMAGRV